MPQVTRFVLGGGTRPPKPGHNADDVDALLLQVPTQTHGLNWKAKRRESGGIIVTFSCMVHSQSATADVLHMGVGLGMHLGRMHEVCSAEWGHICVSFAGRT